jgi:prepilin-type N-terminal cleavage/methylation domain-containing protein
MIAALARRRAEREGGFTLVELLVAMTIALLVTTALAGMAQPAREAFERVPAELELRQRGRIAIEVLSQALRAALIVPGAVGVFEELTVIAPVPAAARGVLSVDQPDAGGAITFGAEHCPNISDVCGFTPKATALIEDDEGWYDVFTVAATNAGARQITPLHVLSQSYPSGAAVLEVEQFTFRLANQSDGSYSLVRETAAGAVQPIVDFVNELRFDVLPGQADILVALAAPTDSLRALVPSRTFQASIKFRNVP